MATKRKTAKKAASTPEAEIDSDTRRRIHAIQNNPGIASKDADDFIERNNRLGNIDEIHAITPQFSGGMERYVIDYTGGKPILSEPEGEE